MSFVLRIGGEAGWGIASASDIFARLAIKLGYYVFASKDYASQIRGGHNNHTIRISKNQVLADINEINILLALDQTTLDLHLKNVKKNGIILIDDKTTSEDSRIITIPLKKIEKKLNEKNIHNAVFLGATAKSLNIPFQLLQEVIEEFFKKKPELAEKIVKAAQEAFNVTNNVQDLPKIGESQNQEFITGNEAIAKGALKAGLTFHAQYPMTPATGILHYLAKEAVSNDKLTVVQPEDEIAVINFALGASAVGARAMCATSGGGFALMVESLGLAGMAEIPLVIVNGQRPGPATGLPTKNAQGDLKFVLSAAPGDFPRVVIAPGNIEECYTETKRALYLAEKYQLPVIVLIDKHLCESFQTVNLPESEFTFDYDKRINIIQEIDENDLNEDGLYKRYQNESLKRPLPATAIFTYAGDEHDEVGYITENPEIATKMNNRRMNKLNLIKVELPKPELIGEKEADLTIVSWGSNKGAIIEAINKVKDKKINFLSINFLSPFQDEVKAILENAKDLFLIEANYSAQLGSLIREKTGVEIENKYLRYDGKVFTVDDIYKKLKEL